jgi:hypothetical protein
LRWKIGGGYLTTSDHTWHMGYGGWSLFFDPRFIETIVSLAFQFPESLGPVERYNEILDSLKNHETYERTQRLFAEP